MLTSRVRGRRGLELTRLVLTTYGRTCHLCGGAGATTADHVWPLALGGHPTALGNLRPAHYACNSSRGARTLPEWYAKHPQYLAQLRGLAPEVLAQLRPVLPTDGPQRAALAPSREW